MGKAEGVDIAMLGPEPNQSVILISCTVDSDISRKISNLKFQANRLGIELLGYTVRKAIFVPVERIDLIKRMLDESAAERTTLVLRPELRMLYEEAKVRN